MPGVNLVGGSTQDYVLGRGKLSFTGEFALFPGAYRDLGNASEFTLTLTSETKKHQSSLEGVKATDIEVLLIQEMQLTFGIDELNIHNLALFLLGDPKGLLASGVGFPNSSSLASTNAAFNPLYFQIAAAGVELWYDLELTLSSGGARIRAFDFEAGQIVTSQDVHQAPAGANTVLVERTSAAPAGDYELDRRLGRIRFYDTATVIPGSVMRVVWAAPAVSKGSAGLDNSLYQIWTLAKSGVKGSLKFIQENPVTGNFTEYQFHQVTLKPEGDFGLISDDWITMKFSAAVEKLSNPPYGGSPYCNVTQRSSYST